MIKLTREELIDIFNKQIVMMSEELSDSTPYWSKDIVDDIQKVISKVRTIRKYDDETEFELVPIENITASEIFAAENAGHKIADIIADKDQIISGLNRKIKNLIDEGRTCQEEVSTDDNELAELEIQYKKIAVRHADDIEKWKKERSDLNAKIVELERQHDSDNKKWGREVMDADTEIDRLSKLILASDIGRQYGDERMREEEHKEYMAARDRIIELEAEIKQLQKYYDYAKTYIPQQKVNKRCVTHDELCPTNSPTSGG